MHQYSICMVDLPVVLDVDMNQCNEIDVKNNREEFEMDDGWKKQIS